MSDLPCDHCEENRGRHMLCVEVKSHEPHPRTGVLEPARVHLQRWWCFCSETCRDAWYETPTNEDLVGAEHRHESDRWLRAAAIHVTPRADGQPADVKVRELLEHETYDSLHRDWGMQAVSETE